MHTVTAQCVASKRVLLRLDLDIPLRHAQGKLEVVDDFRLQAGLPTLELCLTHADSVVICGHLGRPKDEDESLSVAPIVKYLEDFYCQLNLPEGKLHVLENLRFEAGENQASLEFANELTLYGDVYVNEAFAAHHKAASTTILPTLMPSYAGLRFAWEVKKLRNLRDNPKKPLVAIIGGAKIEDKLEAIIALSKFCDAVLVGGLLSLQIKQQNIKLPLNVLLGKLSENGLDLSEEAVEAFIILLKNAKQIIWSGPVGKYEVEEGVAGNLKIAKAIIESGAESIIGGGDLIAAISDYVHQFKFVSVGGGAMLKLLADGTLPTIQALESSKIDN